MWHSRKFRIMVFDAVISSATLAVTWFLAPELANKVVQMIAIFQPVIFAVIAGIAVEDAAMKLNQNNEL